MTIQRNAFMAVALLGMFGLGCSAENHDGAGRAYCDETGCYECDFDSNCWPVPNRRCTNDSQCASSERCTNIGCSARCTADSDCGYGHVCRSGLCGPAGMKKVYPYTPSTGCKDDGDCTSSEYCSAAGKCVDRCKTDEECGPGKVCASCGKCQTQGVPATCGATPSYCSTTVACGSGKSCVSGRCHFQCGTSNSCPVGQVCTKGLCKDDPSPPSPECALDLDCASGVCINGYCHSHCVASTQCGQGDVCQMGVCQPDYHPAN